MKQKLLLLYIAFSFFACKPEPDRTPDKHIYYYLTAEQLAKTPYFTNPAFDTLTYVSNQNDTVVFAKTRVDSGWYRIIDASPGNNYTVYHYYQQLTANYQTIKGEGSFEVMHGKRINGGVSDIVKYSFNLFIFYVGDYAINDPTHPRFVGDVYYNNRTFSNSIYSNHNYNDSAAICYINLDFGIFKINNNITNLTHILINK